ASLLVQRQIRMARLEAEQQLHREKTVAEMVGIGGALALAGTVVMLVAAALAIGEALGHLWLGALIVGGVLLAIAVAIGLVGWSRRVKEPLPRSRRELDKEVTWARHQLTT
ncbi:MAG TPA: phage holin family protein, partial [Kofleriaceae bacterium]|nr:phage holin family protein [Kofleriaceae bacterium]